MSTTVSPPPDPFSGDAPAGPPGSPSSNLTLLYIIIAVLAGVILYMAIRHGQSVLAEWRRLQAGGHADAEASWTRLGLSVDDIAALPTFTYRARAASASPAPYGGGRSRSKGRTPGRAVECVVCLQELEDGDVVRVLPACRRFFHGGCIDAWLCAHSTCPVCRAYPEPERARLAEVAMSPRCRSCDGAACHLSSPPHRGCWRTYWRGRRCARQVDPRRPSSSRNHHRQGFTSSRGLCLRRGRCMAGWMRDAQSHRLRGCQES